MIRKILISIFNFYDQVIFGTEYVHLENAMSTIPKDIIDLVLELASIAMTMITVMVIVLFIYILVKTIFKKMKGETK